MEYVGKPEDSFMARRTSTWIKIQQLEKYYDTYIKVIMGLFCVFTRLEMSYHLKARELTLEGKDNFVEEKRQYGGRGGIFEEKSLETKMRKERKWEEKRVEELITDKSPQYNRRQQNNYLLRWQVTIHVHNENREKSI